MKYTDKLQKGDYVKRTISSFGGMNTGDIAMVLDTDKGGVKLQGFSGVHDKTSLEIVKHVSYEIY